MSDEIIRVLCVDDHPLVREGITALIGKQTDMTVIAEASSGQEALERCREHHPDIILMDLRLSDINGIDALIAIRREFPASRFIMLTMFEGDVEIRRALTAGASAYVVKNTSSKNLLETIRQVHAGKKHISAEIATTLAEHMGSEALTAREVEVLALISGGNRNQDIAAKLFISEQTVKAHINHIMEKLGASDRTQAVAIGVRRGIIQL